MQQQASIEGARQIAEDWLKFTLHDLAENIRKGKIIDTETLLKSLGGNIQAGGGDQLKARITYAIYGKYLDMGVGRGAQAGVKRGDAGYEKKRDKSGRFLTHKRRPRQWYSREIGKQKHALGELMTRYYGRLAIAAATDEMPSASTLTLKFKS